MVSRSCMRTHPYTYSENDYRFHTILSDKHKCLIYAIQNVLPLMIHAFCIKHIEANLNKKFNDAYMCVNLWKVAIS